MGRMVLMWVVRWPVVRWPVVRWPGSVAGGRCRRGWRGGLRRLGFGVHVDGPHPLVQRERGSRGQPPHADRQHVRYAQAGQADRGQADDQPFRALDQAYVGVQAEAFRPGLDVGHRQPGGQAEQADHGEQVVGAHEPDRDAAEDGRIAEPVHRRVEECAVLARVALDPGQLAVEHVGKDEARRDERTREELADREQPERGGGDADGAGDRDHVGGHRGSREPLDNRVEQAREDGTEEVQHGRSRSYLGLVSARCACVSRFGFITFRDRCVSGSPLPAGYLIDSPEGSCGNSSDRFTL